MKIAYFDCFAGASGDMILGALLDAGLPLEALEKELAKADLGHYRLTAEKGRRGLLCGTRCRVIVEEEAPPRALPEILTRIDNSTLSLRTKEQGKAVFQRLGQVEAKVHGLPLEQVHFHEVGATDALVDILGAVAGLELLGVEKVYASPLALGTGVVQTSQGTLPVPAPATLELLAQARAPVRSGPDLEGELLTPTGAVLLTTLASFQRPAFRLERLGLGLGARDYPHFPNALRLWLGEEISQGKAEMLLLETNIDDMNPQLYGHVMEELFEIGALDVWFTPIQMKKNRPAVTLSALVPATLEGAAVEAILRETSTLGLRIQPVSRHEAQREVLEVETGLGRVRVKVKRYQGLPVSLAPEYEDCRRLAREKGLPLQEVFRRVSEEAGARLLGKTAPGGPFP